MPEQLLQAGYALILVAFLAVSGFAIWLTMAHADDDQDGTSARDFAGSTAHPEPVRRVHAEE